LGLRVLESVNGEPVIENGTDESSVKRKEKGKKKRLGRGRYLKNGRKGEVNEGQVS